MSLQPDKLYHFYNQGTNRETFFFSRENLYFENFYEESNQVNLPDKVMRLF